MSTSTSQKVRPTSTPIHAAFSTLGALARRVVHAPSVPIAVAAVTAAVASTACFSCGPLAPPRMPVDEERA